MKLITPIEFNNLRLPENISVKVYEACIDMFIGGKSIIDACEAREIKEDWEIRDLSNAIESIIKQLE